MVSRWTGIHRGTSGHPAQPVFATVVGPGPEPFRGDRDNAEFGKALLAILEAR